MDALSTVHELFVALVGYRAHAVQSKTGVTVNLSNRELPSGLL